MGSITKKLRRALHDEIRNAGPKLVGTLMKKTPDRSTVDVGPMRYRQRVAGMVWVRAARFEVSDGEEIWVLGAHKNGTPMTVAEKRAVDAAALAAARKSAVEADTPVVQGPEAVRASHRQVFVYAWRVCDPGGVVTPGELRHLARLYWRELAG